MTKALGMIETRGLATSIEAADVMLKNSYVQLVQQSMVDAALVTILIEGDVSAVKAAVEAGAELAKRRGALVAFHVIPHPDLGTNQLIRNQQDDGNASKKTDKKSQVNETNVEKEKN
ncbi:BMC domain-containing protein [Neobacillus sp. NPDC097160]|uniref:BMC domain-containing protein n=1 Tax=Neobacillus sp. NPDC097160 TaxID=3364298 RepID=UPI003825CE76